MSQLPTPREAQVVGLFKQGLTNRKIAEKIGIAMGTVKIHVKHAMEKGLITRRTKARLGVSTQDVVTAILTTAQNPRQLLEKVRSMSTQEPEGPEVDVYDWVKTSFARIDGRDVDRAKLSDFEREEVCRRLGK